MRLEDLNNFFEHARKSGVVNPNVVHNWSGAIGAISRCLSDDERTVDFLSSHLDGLKGILSSRRPEISGQTLDSYVQRTSTALSHFRAWREDASKWETEFVTRPRKRSRKPKAVSETRPAPTAPAPAPLPASKKGFVSSGEVTVHRNSVRVPAESGEAFHLEFPESFSMADVQKVAWTLAVHARDFDPEQMLKGFGKPSKSSLPTGR